MRLGPRRREPAPPQFASAKGWTAHLAGEPDDVEGQRCARCAVVMMIPSEGYWPVGSWVAVEDLDKSPSDWPYRSLASRRFMIGLGRLAGNDADNALALLDWELRGGAVCVVVASAE